MRASGVVADMIAAQDTKGREIEKVEPWEKNIGTGDVGQAGFQSLELLLLMSPGPEPSLKYWSEQSLPLPYKLEFQRGISDV